MGAADGGQAEGRGEEAEGGAEPLAGEDHAEDGEPLRDQQGAECPLHEPSGDKGGGAGRQDAGDGGCGEAADADQEQTASSVPVAEAATDHQQDAQGQRVAGAQPLDKWFTPCRSATMVGAATLVMVPSRRSSTAAAMITARMAHLRVLETVLRGAARASVEMGVPFQLVRYDANVTQLLCYKDYARHGIFVAKES